MVFVENGLDVRAGCITRMRRYFEAEGHPTERAEAIAISMVGDVESGYGNRFIGDDIVISADYRDPKNTRPTRTVKAKVRGVEYEWEVEAEERRSAV